MVWAEVGQTHELHKNLVLGVSACEKLLIRGETPGEPCPLLPFIIKKSKIAYWTKQESGLLIFRRISRVGKLSGIAKLQGALSLGGTAIIFVKLCGGTFEKI